MSESSPEMPVGSSAKPRSLLIGFLAIEPTEDGAGFLGGLMVLDFQGYPLEFRCTTPVKPTPIQKLVYGPLLEQFISVELCAKRLLRDVKRKPGIVIVPSPHVLSLGEDDVPIVAVQRAGEVLQVESPASGLVTERLESKAFQPVIVTILGEQGPVVQNAKSVLVDVFGRFDLLEPFERIRTALKFLQQQDPKYR